MARRGAKPGDWKSIPMPSERARVEVVRHYTSDEMVRIRDGLVPEEMEDKWFIVWEGGVLRLHRSWTGFCIYEVRFVQTDDGFAVAQVWANRNADQYGCTDDDRDARLLEWLIDSVLLGHRGPLPALG